MELAIRRYNGEQKKRFADFPNYVYGDVGNSRFKERRRAPVYNSSNLVASQWGLDFQDVGHSPRRLGGEPRLVITDLDFEPNIDLIREKNHV